MERDSSFLPAYHSYFLSILKFLSLECSCFCNILDPPVCLGFQPSTSYAKSLLGRKEEVCDLKEDERTFAAVSLGSCWLPGDRVRLRLPHFPSPPPPPVRSPPPSLLDEVRRLHVGISRDPVCVCLCLVYSSRVLGQ